MAQQEKQAERIQTSILNGIERKILVWLAKRMPRKVTSDMLSFVGFLGSLVICAGYLLSNINIQWLWLASFGLVINWYGDSLDGTLARVRNQQRPKYGYFLDHQLDCINEGMMFVGAGLSMLMNMWVALLIFIAYLIMTVYVTMSAHLKKEFRLTYAALGPTEFRLIIIIINTFAIGFSSFFSKVLWSFDYFGIMVEMKMMDFLGLGIFVILMVMWLVSFMKDLRYYGDMEPLKKNEK
ncbi:MAG: CDP-alcohol phosphatidyltransferase family protein [Paludibacteraceae bacterium]|nr:CDP-alcohol phosphatidyltransferase family protein [Paludibacteraceae bacterium]